MGQRREALLKQQSNLVLELMDIARKEEDLTKKCQEIQEDMEISNSNIARLKKEIDQKDEQKKEGREKIMS